jgi:hypothetical protein
MLVAAAATGADDGAGEPRSPGLELAAVQYHAPAAYPAPRRVGGVVRSSTTLQQLAALVPDHLGLTNSEQPVLYWFLSAPASTAVEFTLIRPGMEVPIVERSLDAASAGIHAIDLRTLGARLETGIEYEWSVALVVDPAQRSRDLVSGGAIMRVAADSSAASDPAQLAARGLWYDALMALGRALETGSDRAVRAERARLLEQAGLAEAARFEQR